MLTGGIGLLPCPLTISVLAFAWIQGTAVMVAVVLATLALGIATTIDMTSGLFFIGVRLMRQTGLRHRDQDRRRVRRLRLSYARRRMGFDGPCSLSIPVHRVVISFGLTRRSLGSETWTKPSPTVGLLFTSL